MESLRFFDVASSPRIQTPVTARTIDKSPSLHELDEIELPDHGLLGARQHPPWTVSDLRGEETNASDKTNSPKTPLELEHSLPGTPRTDDVRGIVPSWSYPSMNKWRHLSACLEYFVNGLNDAAPGALIPYIESWYDIGYAVVSLIWVANAVGFILAAFCTDFINGKLGRARSLMLSEMSAIVAYIILACPVPFPLIVFAYVPLGFGQALNIALNNVFCSNLVNSTVVLGVAHGSYGIGGTIGPILATALVSNGVNWHRFYPIPLGIRVVCLACTGWSFWNYEKEEATQFSNSLVETTSHQGATVSTSRSKLKAIGKAFQNRTTLIGALFIFAYQGVEVSESGWFISYLIDYRNADPKRVGYVTAGFWAGITVGRFVLTHAARPIGEKIYVFGLVVGVIAFQLMAWLIPNIIGDSVAVSVVGLLLGPVYPCAQTIFTRLLPSRVQVFAIGFISSAGSSGGAVVPFLTGLVAQSVGTYVLHPICIGFSILLLACWLGLPRITKKTE